MGQIIQVDPANLILPNSRRDGADLVKLHCQLRYIGYNSAGMPPVFVRLASNGDYVPVDGVTRTSRMAKYSPGTLIELEIVGRYSLSTKGMPTVQEKL